MVLDIELVASREYDARNSSFEIVVMCSADSGSFLCGILHSPYEKEIGNELVCGWICEMFIDGTDSFEVWNEPVLRRTRFGEYADFEMSGTNDSVWASVFLEALSVEKHFDWLETFPDCKMKKPLRIAVSQELSERLQEKMSTMVGRQDCSWRHYFKPETLSQLDANVLMRKRSMARAHQKSAAV